MEANTDILKELSSLSPLIAEMNKTNVFSVPDGYFDSISSKVLMFLPEEQNLFQKDQQGETQGIPAGYFDQLADSILHKIKSGETAIEEIRRLSPLLYDIQHKNVLTVPAGYFESLNNSLFHTHEKSLSKDELGEISPDLYSLRDKNVFQAPGGYFAGLADDILKKIHPQLAPVVKMDRRRLFIKYAAAAVLTGMTLLGGYKYFNKTGPSGENQQAIAVMDPSIEKGKSMDEKQFNETLRNLKSADIANYLESNGDVADVGAIGTYIDDNNLPSREDYLLDGRTLEKYLKKIEKSTNN